MIIYNIFYKPLVNIIGLLLFPICYLIPSLKKRLGFGVKKDIDTIWIHASSVGEINGMKPLILKIINSLNNNRVIITTMTSTGLVTANKLSPKITAYLIPLDIPFLINRFTNLINPKILIVSETEIWPSMFIETNKKKIPLIISNGRLSNHSYPNYLKLKTFLKPLLLVSQKIITQSELDKERFLQLGARNVVNGGNLKFCVDLPKYDNETIRIKYGYKKSDLIITFGSSRPGEEELIINSYKGLAKKYKNLKLVIVLRHIKRVEEIIPFLKDSNYSLLSNFKKGNDILIIDKMGVLNSFYAISDISLVGGSFYDFGGHNPLEPAFYSKPIIMGEYHSSCSDSVAKLHSNNAILISKSDNLTENLNLLLSNNDLRNELGDNAKKTLEQNKKSLDINFKLIKESLHEEN